MSNGSRCINIIYWDTYFKLGYVGRMNDWWRYQYRPTVALWRCQLVSVSLRIEGSAVLAYGRAPGFDLLWVPPPKGVITPNQIPLTTIVTYLQKSYRSRISNHWATIPACSVVPPIYKKSKKTYCHVSF